jgi:protein-tyrosine phosphatase
VLPLVDTHCHLLAGLDDGPRTAEDALTMCRIAYHEGVRLICATAHQNPEWPDVTPEIIRNATQTLADALSEEGLGLTVFPCAEVMVHTEMDVEWEAGRILSIGDRGKYLLMELPHNLFVDLHYTVVRLMQLGLRPILAHPERQPELLHEPGQIERLIRVGCLVQVSTKSITHPANREDERALRDWFKRGVVHVLGSDGHSPRRRQPRMAEAYRRVVDWVGPAVATRIGSANGTAILQGLPLQVPEPAARRRHWFALWS